MSVSPPLSNPVCDDAAAGGRFYRPELDSLRFFAFFAVFLLHTLYPAATQLAQQAIPAWIPIALRTVAGAGAYGVDLFFVLSAYLITELLLREKRESGTLHVRAFYLRRMLRIWPLYFFFIFLAYFVPYFNPAHTNLRWKYVVWFSLLAGNWSVVVFGWPGRIIAPLWSVSVEEQFYVLWPPLVKKLSRENIARAAWFMIVVANLARVIVLAMHGGQPQLWCNTFTRLDPIAFGVLIATSLHGKATTLTGITRSAFTLLGVTLLLGVSYFADIGTAKPVTWAGTLIGYPLVAASCALIVAATIGSPVVFLRWNSLRYLGKVSYGLYVYHELAIFLTNKMLGQLVPGTITRTLIEVALALLITIAISALSYAVLETPFLKLKRRFTFVESRPV